MRTILDAPCGDLHWLSRVDLPIQHYIGVDIVDELIEGNRRHHAQPRRSFLTADITKDALPVADLILCRDALIHFSYEDIFRVFRNFSRTGASYLLTTSFPATHANRNIFTGAGWRHLNLEIKPFCLPPPVSIIHDAYNREDQIVGLWLMSDVPTSPQ